MANPQKENGFTPIANDIIDQLCKAPLNDYEHRCLYFLLRKTYGWRKKKDRISLSQFSQGTGIPKPHVCRTMKTLVRKKIVTRTGNGYHVNYEFQKDYDLWECLPKQVMPVTPIGNEPLPNQVDTKYNKEIITKEKNQPDKLAQFSKEFMNNAEKAKELGLNIYQLLGKAKKDGLSSKIPEIVLMAVLDEVLNRHVQIQDPFPYFLRVLKDKSSQYFSQRNEQEGEFLKKQPMVIKDILALILKNSSKNTDHTVVDIIDQKQLPVSLSPVSPGSEQVNQIIDLEEIKTLKSIGWKEPRIRDHFIKVRGYAEVKIDDALAKVF